MTRGKERSGRGRKRLRRWPRRILLAVNLVVAICLVSTGTVYAYVRYRINSIHTVAAPHLTPTAPHAQDASGGLAPENILLIGNETRAGLGTDAYGSPTTLTGALSDVIMILHLDPSKQTASILSIPRDVFVPQPAGSPVGPYQKVDAALNDGAQGPDNLIQTITTDFGIPINHYIELNFNGFQSTVNALGGINLNFPEPVYDLESGLNIKTTGCQHLTGAQALAVVRSRHLQYDPPGVSPDDVSAWPYDPESDLSRIVRDHAFLRALASEAKSEGLTNPIKANAFLSGLINQITVDPGLRDQLVTLAAHYRRLNVNAAPQTTLPVLQVGGSSGYSYGGAAMGDVEFADQPLDDQVISRWDGQALPTPVAPTSVQVVDATDSSDASHIVDQGLSGLGLPVVDMGQATVQATPAPTWVDYAPGQEAQGLDVMNDLTGTVMLQVEPTLAAGTVQVEVGTQVGVVTPTSPATAPTPSTSSAGSTTTSTTGSTTTTTTSGDNSGVAPTPSSATDQIAPWDPRPC